MKVLNNIVLIVTVILGGAVLACADTTITASPLGGGVNLDFGTVASNRVIPRTLTLDMVYTDNQSSYSVYYEVTTPFTNASGTLLADGAITFHTVIGSNQSGTLFQTDEGNLRPGQNQIYFGNNPTSDHFDVIYKANASAANAQGLFHGVIRYKILSADGQSQAIDYLDVYVNFDLTITTTVTGSTTSNYVHMIYPNSNPPVYAFTISFADNTTGDLVKVSQILKGLPQSITTGRYLAADAVKFHTADPVNGTDNYPNPTVLTVAPQEIYSSTASKGSVKSVFEFDSSMGTQEAGRYITTITYKVEWSGRTYLMDVQFEVENAPTFEMHVTAGPNVQMNGNAFVMGRNLTAVSGNKDVPIIVDVNTNMGKPYRVTYAMPTGLTNQATGQSLILNDAAASNNLQQFQFEMMTGEGNIMYPGFTSAVKGTFSSPVNVFVSNGASARLRVTYRLALTSATAGIPGGDYRAPFVLTLMLN